MKIWFVIVLTWVCSYLGACGVDLVIFSYNRPLQLYALLESIQDEVVGLGQQTVVYRASHSMYEDGYAIVQRDFPEVVFKKQQNERAKEDFKPLVLESAFSKDSKANYLLFAVDDIVITRPIDLVEAVEIMEQEGAYACFFRLGLDIDHCYMLNQRSGVPLGRFVGENYFSWQFSEGKGDWIYPNNVDFTLYRKKDISPFFFYAPYTFPNDLEAYWARFANNALHGICPKESCMVNIPLNVVSSFRLRNMAYKTAEELLLLFMQGYKIDLSIIKGVKHNSPHFEIYPSFIKRSIESKDGL